jgi:hypothetical protein
MRGNSKCDVVGVTVVPPIRGRFCRPMRMKKRVMCPPRRWLSHKILAKIFFHVGVYS